MGGVRTSARSGGRRCGELLDTSGLLGSSPPRMKLLSTLSALVLLAACSPPTAKWSVVLEKRPGALISLWGESPTDVWAVGGDSGAGPEVLHLEGATWTRLATGARGDLWWVFGFEKGPVFFGGSQGLLLRREGSAFEVLPPPSPTTATVFGVWGPSATDLWAVGGDGNSKAFAWRFDGTQWRDVPLPGALATTHSLFKVWGRSADDVWFVGSKGLCLHWTGAAFETVTTPTNRTLFTIHGTSTRLVAVGGFGTGVVLEHDGAAWSDVSPPDGKQMTGVRMTDAGGWAAGTNGAVLSRTATGWVQEEPGPAVFDDLHAAWVDPAGGVWVAGGQVSALPLVNGVLAYKGTSPPPSTVAP